MGVSEGEEKQGKNKKRLRGKKEEVKKKREENKQ